MGGGDDRVGGGDERIPYFTMKKKARSLYRDKSALNKAQKTYALDDEIFLYRIIFD